MQETSKDAAGKIMEPAKRCPKLNDANYQYYKMMQDILDHLKVCRIHDKEYAKTESSEQKRADSIAQPAGNSRVPFLNVTDTFVRQYADAKTRTLHMINEQVKDTLLELEEEPDESKIQQFIGIIYKDLKEEVKK